MTNLTYLETYLSDIIISKLTKKRAFPLGIEGMIIAGLLVLAFGSGLATSLVKTIFEPRLTVAPAPERELRGAWLATVLNIDYPRRPTIDAATLRAEYKSQLTRLRKLGINAIFVQVRSVGDAFYPSELAPWSRWLTGRQGLAPALDFDPLAYLVEESHAQGIAFHAWVNPYRMSTDLDTLALADDHLFYRHRDWVHRYGDRLYLDPGLPEVRGHLLAVIGEIVDRYAVDGIHFDDYFYPYPKPDEQFPDSMTFARYGDGRMSLGDWRRSNVNAFVEQVHDLIRRKKPWVQFGISPFGVWRNQDRDPAGSATRAFATSYDDLYADALAWSRAGTIDYLAPQLYWHLGFAAADYGTLLDWWTENLPASTKLIVGHAAYKVGTDRELAWHDLEEIPRQIDRNRRGGRVAGSIFFSTKSLLDSPVELDARLADVYTSPRLLPPQAAPPSAGPPPLAPRLQKVRASPRGPLLVWEAAKDTPDEDLPYYYAVYRQAEPEAAAELIHVTPFAQNCRRLHFYDEDASLANGKLPTYEVRALDRYHRESGIELP